MMSSPHQPVLFKEIIHALQPRRGGRYIDGTVGAGGHAHGILEACAPDGRLLGLDLDPQALALARKILAPYEQRVFLAQASYTSLPHQLAVLGWEWVDGILLDLGASSMQFESATRGFSFQHEAPLDMRFDPTATLTAAQLVNELPEHDLAELLRRFGEEPRARTIARAIARNRPVRTTTELVKCIGRADRRGGARIHPATRTFQALRIAVNAELTGLQQVLPLALAALRAGGRLAVISFHSLEDRIVKEFLRAQSKEVRNPPFETIYDSERDATLRIVEKKPIVPTDDELCANPRARSAKLRVAEKL
jgi:16S rRNA (cytosine1402-N4)-methyltransferase